MHPFKSLILFTCIVLIQPQTVDAEKKDYWDNIADVIIMYDLYDNFYTPNGSQMTFLKQLFEDIAIVLNVSSDGNRMSIFKVGHRSSEIILSLNMGVDVDLVVGNVNTGVTSADLIRISSNRTNYEQVFGDVKRHSNVGDRDHIPNVFLYIATTLDDPSEKNIATARLLSVANLGIVMSSYDNSSMYTSRSPYVVVSKGLRGLFVKPFEAADFFNKFFMELLDKCSSVQSGPYCQYDTDKTCAGYYHYKEIPDGDNNEHMCVRGNETIRPCDPVHCDDKCQDVKKFTDEPCTVTCGEGQTIRKPKNPKDPVTGNCPDRKVNCTGKPCPPTTPMTTSTSHTPTSTSTTSTTTKLTPAGLSTEMIAIIAGVSGGCLLVVIIIATICYKKKRSARRARSRHHGGRPSSYSQSQASSTERSDIHGGNGYGGRHGPGGPGRRPSVPPRYPPPGRASRTPGGRRAPPGRYNVPRMPPRGGHARRPY